IALASVCSSRLQLEAAPHMRGRVMALWAVAVIGTRPLGGPLVGAVGQHLGPRYALGLGGVTVLLVALPLWWLLGGARVRAAPARPRHRSRRVAVAASATVAAAGRTPGAPVGAEAASACPDLSTGV